MDLWELVNQFGLPVALLIYFIVDGRAQAKEHRNDLRDTVTKSVAALDKSTDAINDSAKVIEKNTTAFSDNSHILSDVKVLLSNRGTQNDRSN